MLCSASKGGVSSNIGDIKIAYASLSKAKILAQIKEGKTVVPIEILAQAKAKDSPNDALPNFLELYTSHSRVGTLQKESHSGKLIKSWESAVADAKKKPELVDMSPAVSSFMAVKDDDELVRPIL
jgi:nucleosome binding factor SPN SPT16 subunit